MVRYSVEEQRQILGDISPEKRKKVEELCACHEGGMKGAGLKDIYEKVRDTIGPIAKAIGPTVLKELIIPLIKSKIGLGNKGKKGKGVKLAGEGVKLAGEGLSLAGEGLSLAGEGVKLGKKQKKKQK